MPDDHTVVVERFRDEVGDWRVCVLTPYGGRVHAPWSLAWRLSRRTPTTACPSPADAGHLVLLTGPLEGDREVLMAIEAPLEDDVRGRLAEDPWAPNGMLRPIRVERCNVVLDGPL